MPNATCLIDGCTRIVGAKGAKGMCPKHYQAHRLQAASPCCAVEGCEKRAHSRGWCPMHYQRWRATGDVGSAEMARMPNVGECSVDGCDQPMRKRTWCASHYAQWRRLNDVKPFLYKRSESPPKPPKKFRYKWYGDDITYGHAHKRVRNARGKATGYACVDCGGPAAEWSYDHSDADERYSPTSGAAFSLDVNRYVPRCVRCHRIADANPITLKRMP